MKIQKHSLFSFLALVLFVASSLVNILWAEIFYPSSEVYASFYPNDAINLVFGTIVLLLSHFKVVRASEFYLPCRSGILLFILYNAIASVYAMRSALSILVLILGVAALLTLVESVEYQKLLGTQPTTNHPKLYSAILICMALLFLVRAIILLVRGGHTTAEIAVNLADLVLCSLWLANGIGFLKNQQKCFLAAFICYIHASLLCISLLLFMLVQPLLLGTTFSLSGFLFIATMSLVFFVPLFFLGKSVNRAEDAVRDGEQIA